MGQWAPTVTWLVQTQSRKLAIAVSLNVVRLFLNSKSSSSYVRGDAQFNLRVVVRWLVKKAASYKAHWRRNIQPTGVLSCVHVHVTDSVRTQFRGKVCIYSYVWRSLLTLVPLLSHPYPFKWGRTAPGVFGWHALSLDEQSNHRSKTVWIVVFSALELAGRVVIWPVVD